MPTLSNHHLRSNSVNEIISRKPGKLTRWALFVFLMIPLMLLCISWFIHFPDSVKTRAVLTATNAPKEIMANQGGRLVKLFVEDDQLIKTGQVIGFIESTARHSEVLLLNKHVRKAIEEIEKNNTQNVTGLFTANFSELGEIQPFYQHFIIAFRQFTDYLSNGFYLKKKSMLASDVAFLQKKLQLTAEEKKLMDRDLILSEETFISNDSLFADKIISRQDKRNEESKLLNKQISVPQMNATLLSAQMEIREKEKDILELEHTINQQKLIFEQELQTLQIQIADWINKYVLQSPIEGKVSFVLPLQENQVLTAGKLLGFIIPQNVRVLGEMNIPQQNAGRIDTGQIVQLRFDAYPYQEYGYVKGKLKYISNIASDSGFRAYMVFPENLKTSLNKIIPYRPGLRAEAMIITKETRLFKKFYDNIYQAVKK